MENTENITPQAAPDTGNVIDITAKVKARVDEELAAGSGGGGEIDKTYIEQCLWRQATGDGELYARVHRGKYVFVNNYNIWLRWTGYHWEYDDTNDAMAAVEDIAHIYNQFALDLPAQGNDDLRDTLYKRAKRLRGKDGRADCLLFARTIAGGLAISGKEIDTKPLLLAVKNGVIDLATGRLVKSNPDDYLMRSASASWVGIDEPASEWEAFLLTCLQKQVLVDFMRLLCGYAITGLSTEHILPILTGIGRNGKGTLVEVLMSVLGNLAGPIPSSMLLDQGTVKNSAGPSGDIMELKGLRIAIASETDEHRRFSGSQVKWLTGGDKLTGRLPYDKRNTVFEPTHTLFLMTNHLPHVSPEDYAFWQRVFTIPFNLCFVSGEPKNDNERKADKGLKERLMAMGNQILSWLVRGCLEFRLHGLNPPPEVLEATENYRKEEDRLAEWLEARTVQGKFEEEESSVLYDDYKHYWFNNISRKNTPSHKKFGMDMTKRFFKKTSAMGLTMYVGLRLISPTPDSKF